LCGLQDVVYSEGSAPLKKSVALHLIVPY